MFSCKSKNAVVHGNISPLSDSSLSRLSIHRKTARDKEETARDKSRTARDKTGTDWDEKRKGAYLVKRNTLFVCFQPEQAKADTKDYR